MLGSNASHTGRSPYAGPSTAPTHWKWSAAPSRYTFYTSPVIGADGTIYAYDRDSLRAIRPNGTLRWVSRFAEWGVAASPALASDGTIYLATGNGMLYAVDERGTEKWHFKGTGYPRAPTVGDDGTVYFGTDMSVWGNMTDWEPERAGYMYAVNADGTLRWSWKTGRIVSPPAVGPDGTIYWTSLDGNLYALDPATGNRKWTFDAAAGWGGDIGLTWPSVGEDGTIYLGRDDTNLLFAVHPDGTQRWAIAVPVPAGISTLPGECGLSPPAIAADGTVCLTLNTFTYTSDSVAPDSGALFAFYPDGSQKWTCALAGPTMYGRNQAPVIDSNGVVYVTVPEPGPDHGNAGGLYAIDAEGTLKWSFTARQGPSGALFDPLYLAIAADGTLYLGSFSKELYAFGGPAPTPPPHVTRLSPTAAHRRAAVVITGTGFGNERGIGCVKFGTTKCIAYLSWSDSRIECRVPAKAKFGKLKVSVVTTGGTSSTKTFTVTR
jgi:outer membrane protein assembly factor BamB